MPAGLTVFATLIFVMMEQAQSLSLLSCCYVFHVEIHIMIFAILPIMFTDINVSFIAMFSMTFLDNLYDLDFIDNLHNLYRSRLIKADQARSRPIKAEQGQARLIEADQSQV